MSIKESAKQIISDGLLKIIKNYTEIALLINACDISKNRYKKMEQETEVVMRMYFTDSSYIPVILSVRHGKEVVAQDGTLRMQYGCEFDKSSSSFEAMQSFIDFLYKFAEHSAIDRGDTKVYFK